MIDEGELLGTPDAARIDAADRVMSFEMRCFVDFARARRNYCIAE